MASVLFGAALLCSGQSSTLTGTMAGQIVMEGFLHFRMQPWLRRLITRCVAITPAILTIYFAGDSATYQLIILSQVILNLQLPFAVIPLVHFSSDRKRMGEFANGLWLRIASWATAAFILALDVWLIVDQIHSWVSGNGTYRNLIVGLSTVAALGFAVLLVVITCWPWFRKWPVRAEPVAVREPADAPVVWSSRSYSSILVPLDHTAADHEALSNALALARMHNARIILLHVEEGVTSRMFGSLSSTAEITEGQDYLAGIGESLRNQGIAVEMMIRHGNPVEEIEAAVQEQQPDLLVMASHGHKGIKDLIFGTTINSVRHRVKTSMLIVRKS
jgi:manganese transport protein